MPSKTAISKFGSTELSKEDAALAALYESTIKEFTEGTIVSGTISEVRANEVLVDIGYKSEGSIAIAEFRNPEDVALDAEIEVLLEAIENDDGMIVLSKQKAEVQRNWDSVVNNCNEGDTVEGRVRSRVKGGMIVDVMGIDAFLPGSQVDVVPVRNPDEFVGNTFQFKVLKINEDRRNIVVSRRELLEEERKVMRQQLLKTIESGQIRKGIVKNITDFGAFIDLNGLDGLLHITDMTWGRINHPSEVLKIAEEVEVMILEVDLVKERVSLGLKQLHNNPWEGIESKFPIASRIKGKVVNLMPYGAFVELEEGVEGLVHVSEISWTKRVTRASDVLSIGQEVEAVILNVNSQDKKISLGMRQTERNPWEMLQDEHPIGSIVHGKVRNFTNYGAFVELNHGVDGMIHVSDMSWTKKINNPADFLDKGQDVTAVVLEIDANNQRISLGLKQAQEDPWANVTAQFSVGQIVKGKVSKITTFGAFVEMEEGIEGLVHISQISDQRVENVKEVINPGDEVEARIIKIDTVDRRIGLSIKAAKIADEDFTVSDEMLEGLKSGDDLVDLGSAFDEVITGSEEWHPGDK